MHVAPRLRAGRLSRRGLPALGCVEELVDPERRRFERLRPRAAYPLARVAFLADLRLPIPRLERSLEIAVLLGLGEHVLPPIGAAIGLPGQRPLDRPEIAIAAGGDEIRETRDRPVETEPAIITGQEAIDPGAMPELDGSGEGIGEMLGRGACVHQACNDPVERLVIRVCRPRDCAALVVLGDRAPLLEDALLRELMNDLAVRFGLPRAEEPEPEVAVGLPPVLQELAAASRRAGVDLSGRAKVWLLIGPGRSGKTLLARWLAHHAQTSGREMLMAALDPQNRSLASFFAGVEQPPTNDAAATARWLEELLVF